MIHTVNTDKPIWSSSDKSDRAGVIMFRQLPEDDKIQLLMIQNRHSIGWSFLLEDDCEFKSFHIKNMYDDELKIMLTFNETIFAELTAKHRTLYPDIVSRYDNLKGNRRELNNFIRRVRQWARDPTNMKPRWTFPKGYTHDDETLRETAVREFSEETGIIIKLSDLNDEQKIRVKDRSIIIEFWLIKDTQNRQPNVAFNDEVGACDWINYDEELDGRVSLRDARILKIIPRYFGRSRRVSKSLEQVPVPRIPRENTIHVSNSYDILSNL